MVSDNARSGMQQAPARSLFNELASRRERSEAEIGRAHV